MVQYINKDALVAEIERRLEELNPKKGEFMGRPLRSVNPKTFPRESELEKLLLFLDTIEVKDVDLDKEIDDYMAKEWEGIEEDKLFYDMIKSNLSDIAKHFFELGLKAQKGI